MNNRPIVGSIVHYYGRGTGPEAAIVTGVVSEECVDVHIFGKRRPGFSLDSVLLLASRADVPNETNWCEWPRPEEEPARFMPTGKTTPASEFLPDLPREETPAVEEVRE